MLNIENFQSKNDINSIINILDSYEFDLSKDDDLHLVCYYLRIKSNIFDYDFIPLMKKLKLYNNDTKAIYYITKYRIFKLKYHLEKLKLLNVKNMIINLYTSYYVILSHLNLYDFDIFKTKIIELYNTIDITNDKFELKVELKYFIFKNHIIYLVDSIENTNKPKYNLFNEIQSKITKAASSNNLENLTNGINEFKHNYNFPKFVNCIEKHIALILNKNKTKDDILYYCEIIDFSPFGQEYHTFKYCHFLIQNINKTRILKNYELYHELMIILISKANIKPKFDLQTSIECTENAYKTDILKDRRLIVIYVESRLNHKKCVDIFLLYDYILSVSKNPSDFLNIFKKYKNYLLYYNFSSSTNNHFKLGLTSLLLQAIIKTNSYNYMDEINFILKYYESNEKNIKFSDEEIKNLTFLKEKVKSVNDIINLIQKFDFEIIKTNNNNYNSFLIDNNNEKICIICLEEINNNIRMVKCNKCLKFISHINCLCEWLITKQKCPYCNK